MLNNLIDKILKKQGFIRVPESWPNDYKAVVRKNQEANKLIDELVKQHNLMLEQLASAKGVKYIRDALDELGIDHSKKKTKKDLLKMFMEAFALEEEVK